MIKMINLEKLNAELEKFTLEDCLLDKEKLDKLFKLLSIKQALAQIEQAKAQLELFETVATANRNIDANTLQDIVEKFTNK